MSHRSMSDLALRQAQSWRTPRICLFVFKNMLSTHKRYLRLFSNKFVDTIKKIHLASQLQAREDHTPFGNQQSIGFASSMVSEQVYFDCLLLAQLLSFTSCGVETSMDLHLATVLFDEKHNCRVRAFRLTCWLDRS